MNEVKAELMNTHTYKVACLYAFVGGRKTKKKVVDGGGGSKGWGSSTPAAA